MAQLAFTFRVGARRMLTTWRVIAVDGAGHGHGSCGHYHATSDDAAACPWSPPGWDDMTVCDLLVRQVRDDRVATPARRRAA